MVKQNFKKWYNCFIFILRHDLKTLTSLKFSTINLHIVRHTHTQTKKIKSTSLILTKLKKKLKTDISVNLLSSVVGSLNATVPIHFVGIWQFVGINSVILGWSLIKIIIIKSCKHQVVQLELGCRNLLGVVDVSFYFDDLFLRVIVY